MSKFYPAGDGTGASARFIDYPKDGIDGAEKVPHIEIKVAGSTDGHFAEVTTDDYGNSLIVRFKDAWEAYKGEQEVIEGTPLEEIPGLGDATAALWRARGIVTAEVLVDMPEAHLREFGGKAKEVQKAAKLLVENKKYKEAEEAPKPTPKRKAKKKAK